jgi:hypothetical protein
MSSVHHRLYKASKALLLEHIPTSSVAFPDSDLHDDLIPRETVEVDPDALIQELVHDP